MREGFFAPHVFLKTAAASLFAVIFPSDCRVCAAPLKNISFLPVCEKCLDAIRPIEGNLCAICSERTFSLQINTIVFEGNICGMCRRMPPPFVCAQAYSSYDGELRELLHLLKYENVRPAANYLGELLSRAVHSLNLGASTPLVVIPVPLYRGKRRQRGFNQAELLARVAAKKLGSQFKIKTGCLIRKRETKSQTGLTRHQRRANVRGAFAVTQPSQIAGKDILLIDDVFTTGTTASECARVLLRAGANRIYVATVARVLKNEVSRELKFRPAVAHAAAAADT